MQLGFLAVDGPTPELWEGANWTSAQWMRDNVEIAGRRGMRVNFAVNLNQEFGRGGSKLGNHVPAPTTNSRFCVIPSSSPSADTESVETNQATQGTLVTSSSDADEPPPASYETEQDHQLGIFVPEDDEDEDLEYEGTDDHDEEEREGEEETYHESNLDSYRRRLRDRSTFQATREPRSDGHETSDRRRETQQPRSLRARNYSVSSPPIDRAQTQNLPLS